MTEPPQFGGVNRSRPGEINERWSILLLCGAVLLLCSVLGINALDKVYLPPFADFGMPTVCATKNLFHVDCAGCGITRSLVSIGHGDWRASLAYHPAGLALYGFLWAQVVYQFFALRRLKNGLTGGRSRFLAFYGYALIAAFVVTGIFRWFF